MRKLISFGLLFWSYVLIQTNISILPRCIPTHFNAGGNVDGWGSPDMLWTLLAAQAFTTALFLIVPLIGERFPAMVNLGTHRLSDYTAAQRVRIQPLLRDLAAYLSIVMNLFFVFMLNGIIGAARQTHPHLPIAWPLGFLMGSMLCIVLYYIRKTYEVAKEVDPKSEETGVTP